MFAKTSKNQEELWIVRIIVHYKEHELLKHFLDLARIKQKVQLYSGETNHPSEEKLEEIAKMVNTSLVKLMLSIKKDAFIVDQEKIR